MLRQFFLFTALSMSTVAVAQDKAALDFGAREGVADVSLSPDGTKIAYIIPDKGQGSRLFTVDIADGGKSVPALSATGDPERPSYCE